MSTYISIRIILVEITFITETFNTITTINRLDMIYSQHLSVSYNIYLLQQLGKNLIIRVYDLVEVLSYEFYTIF